MAQDDAGRMYLQIRPIEDGFYAKDYAVTDQLQQLIYQWGEPCIKFPRSPSDTVFIMYYYPSKRGRPDEEMVTLVDAMKGMEMITCTPGTTMVPVRLYPDAFFNKNDDFRRRTGLIIGKVRLLK